MNTNDNDTTDDLADAMPDNFKHFVCPLCPNTLWVEPGIEEEDDLFCHHCRVPLKEKGSLYE